jgi:hypothetical protein
MTVTQPLQQAAMVESAYLSLDSGSKPAARTIPIFQKLHSPSPTSKLGLRLDSSAALANMAA